MGLLPPFLALDLSGWFKYLVEMELMVIVLLGAEVWGILACPCTATTERLVAVQIILDAAQCSRSASRVKSERRDGALLWPWRKWRCQPERGGRAGGRCGRGLTAGPPAAARRLRHHHPCPCEMGAAGFAGGCEPFGRCWGAVGRGEICAPSQNSTIPWALQSARGEPPCPKLTQSRGDTLRAPSALLRWVFFLLCAFSFWVGRQETSVCHPLG